MSPETPYSPQSAREKWDSRKKVLLPFFLMAILAAGGAKTGLAQKIFNSGENTLTNALLHNQSPQLQIPGVNSSPVDNG